jgi:hypothetical protein
MLFVVIESTLLLRVGRGRYRYIRFFSWTLRLSLSPAREKALVEAVSTLFSATVATRGQFTVTPPPNSTAR